MQSTTAPLLNLKVSLRALPTRFAGALTVESVAGVPVQSATRDTFDSVSNNFLEPSALSTANLRFGKLEAPQFASLKSEFGGLSKVPYQSNREYEATDFLPPALQALTGRDLEIPDRALIPGSSTWELLPWEEDKPVDLTANCHGTAWEAMQAYQGQDDLDIFFGDATRIEGHLEDSEKFDKLFTTPAGEKLSTENLKAGDVVGFFNPNGASICNLLHTATYAGGGLFFEKPDTEGRENSDAPYRLSTPDMATRPIEHFLEGPVEARAYRPKKALEQPEVAFSAVPSETVAQWEATHGQPLGMPLLSQLELSIGGGIRGEYLTTLVDQAVGFDASGRGVPLPS